MPLPHRPKRQRIGGPLQSREREADGEKTRRIIRTGPLRRTPHAFAHATADSAQVPTLDHPTQPKALHMRQDMRAELGRIPTESPTFNTERFTITPLRPPKLRELAEILLRDEGLAEQVEWMADKSQDGARREAFLLELQATAGTTQGWGIVERARRMFVGAVLARQAMSGIDLEVLCPAQFWDQGISDEVGAPLAEWLADNIEVELVHRQ